MSGSRQKKMRAQQREGGRESQTRSRLTEMRHALQMRGSRRTDREIAVWLTKAVWRQQAGATCVEATATLSNALRMFGISNRVVPVAIIADDAVTHRRNIGGTAATRFLIASGELQPGDEPRRPDGAPAFFVDGAHAVVVCEELDLLLDPTFDQFGVTGVPLLIADLSLAASNGDATWQYGIGPDVDGRQSAVDYIEVDDVIVLESELPHVLEVAARELAAVAVTVDFGESALEIDAPLYLSAERLMAVVDAMDNGDPSPLHAFRERRAIMLATKGYHESVPLVWTIAPAEVGH